MNEQDNTRHITKLEKHIEDTKSNIKYSLDRFDVLIITLSSGGIVFSLGFLKDIVSSANVTNFVLLKIAWMFFGSAIISNLFSQVTAYFASKSEIKCSKNIIRIKRGKEPKGDQAKYEHNQKMANTATMALNGTSLILLIAAIVLLIIFMNINLN